MVHTRETVGALQAGASPKLDMAENEGLLNGDVSGGAANRGEKAEWCDLRRRAVRAVSAPGFDG